MPDFPPAISIDLTRPPARRWSFTSEQREQAWRLARNYMEELPPTRWAGVAARAYAVRYLRRDHRAEMRSIARQLGCSSLEILFPNLYYDALKYALGCTGIAFDTPDGPMHARNLDWPVENDMLAEYTVAQHFVGAPAGSFRAVGWPGFTGVLSGMAPGRFSVTLNAVSSTESPTLGHPAVFMLREALERAPDFSAAVETFATRRIVNDCLLLVVGVRAGEMAAIERTPTRAAIRRPENGCLVVTNHYVAMPELRREPRTELGETAEPRFDYATGCLAAGAMTDADSAFAVLQSPGLRRAITMQHMVMQPSTGLLEVRRPVT